MSQASFNKDHIETVIFTPTTTYHCEKPDCVQERVVSYENMDELNAKLYNLYSSNNGMFPTTTRRLDVRQTSSTLEEEEQASGGQKIYLEEDDEADLPYRLHPSSSRRHVIEPIPMPPPTPSPAKTVKAPKEKNRLRRFYSKGW
eukprot:CAMPEP_0117011594 /NCGR_PEP_ID=MMETSP0472-20121206/9939_1 /TAXON_ID=693140 ORGANISM="Tiarina fusus, Strain LIS" /NCGR_SAMPLE_ID=MMETSP0472 /ASSEMBLY_ACC=CAM_ASM_000603 /LENGTH=143 /DNA_ID=CAMNT_0004714449 /DNA_START=177 /DNA_END=605 /DNA_ORIENTATION=+